MLLQLMKFPKKSNLSRVIIIIIALSTWTSLGIATSEHVSTNTYTPSYHQSRLFLTLV
jgi:hypothetical protein